MVRRGYEITGWADIGTQTDRVAFLREFWPDLVRRIEREAHDPLRVAARDLVEYLDARGLDSRSPGPPRPRAGARGGQRHVGKRGS